MEKKLKISVITVTKNSEKFLNENLKSLEKQKGFGESVKGPDGNKIPFFDKGQSREWSKTLDENLKQDIEKCFKNEMIELDYL